MLQRRQDYKAKKKASLSSGKSQGNVRAGTNPTSFPDSHDVSQSPIPPGSDKNFSVRESVGLEDSVSQIPGCKVSPWGMSTLRILLYFWGFR